MINFVGYIGTRFFGRELERTGPSLTFERLCTSRHIDDLQAIASVAIFTIAICFVLLAMMSWNLAAWKDQMIFLGGIIATATAALSWTYQSGSRRLGAVDLFASEISAICRVCLIVDFAKISVASLEAPRGAEPANAPADAYFGRYTSQEHYTPAYDTSIADLQALDFEVVTSVTRFYTYRMTMLDLMRKAAEPGQTQQAALLRQMIFMQYLMYESARHAIVQLIEFEPHQSEAVVNVLCSELVLYGFLQPSYEDSFQGERLNLRIGEYDAIVARMSRRIAENGGMPNWLHAATTAPELMVRYAAMKASVAAEPVLRQAA